MSFLSYDEMFYSPWVHKRHYWTSHGLKIAINGEHIGYIIDFHPFLFHKESEVAILQYISKCIFS